MAPDEETRRRWLEGHNRLIKAKKERDVATLAAALDDPDHASTALRYLQGLRAPEAIGPLIRTLDSPDHYVRASSIRALGRLDARNAAPLLRRLAREDPDGSVRAWASGVLVDWRDPEAFESTVPLLKDPSVIVRGGAVYSLTQLADPRAVEALREARPHIRGSFSEWWMYGGAYRRAISAGRRGRPRSGGQVKWLGRAREAAWALALAVVTAALWIYIGVPWGIGLITLAAAAWIYKFAWFWRRMPLD